MLVDYDLFKIFLVFIFKDFDLFSNCFIRFIIVIFWSVWLGWFFCGSRGSFFDVLSICKNKGKFKLKD